MREPWGTGQNHSPFRTAPDHELWLGLTLTFFIEAIDTFTKVFYRVSYCAIVDLADPYGSIRLSKRIKRIARKNAS